VSSVIQVGSEPGFYGDGRPLDAFVENLMDKAMYVVAPANGNQVTLVWPNGAKIGITKPLARRVFSPTPYGDIQMSWRGAGGIGTRRGTEFVAKTNLGSHMIHFYSFPYGEMTDITLRAEAEQSAGSLIYLEKCYRSKFRIDSIDGLVCIMYADCAGITFDHCHTLAGALQTPNADWRGRPFKAGAVQWFAAPGGAGNNSITLEECSADPIYASEATSNIYASMLIRSMDGMRVWGGHFAGGRYAHLLLEPSTSYPVNGVHFHESWFDFFAARTVQAQGNGHLSNLYFHGGTMQGAYELNFSLENALSTDVHLLDVVNEACRGDPANASYGTYLANATDVTLRGTTRGNGRAGDPMMTALMILKSKIVDVHQRIKGNNVAYPVYVGNQCDRVDLSKSVVDHGTSGLKVYDDGTNTNSKLQVM
jgi:hypothetical protein